METTEAKTNQGTSLDFEIPAFYNAFSLDNSFGGIKIGLYRSKDERNYFYTPLIIVNWEDFQIQLSEKKEEFADKEEILELSLLINHSDKEIEKNIEAKIIAIENAKRVKEKKENITTTDISLNLLPFKFFKVYAKVGDKKQWLNEDDFIGITPEDNFTTQISMISERAYIIKGSFKQLSNFFNNKRTNLIWANLFGDGSPYSTTTISAIATFFNDSRNSTKIFGDEDIVRKNIVSSSSSGGGFGISAGPISIGGGTSTSSVTSQKQVKRYFNRTFISNALSNSKSEINLVVDGDTTKYTEFIKQFVDKLFENKNKIVADIEKDSDNTFKLINDQILNVTVTDSGSILSAKPQIDKNDDNDVEFKYGGVSGSSKTKNKFKTQDDITWEIKNGEPIPIKVDLFLLNESQLKDEFSSLAILFNREAKKNSITPFLYPAIWNSKKTKYNESVIDKDNPIGSILAFAGIRESIPLGWLLCDGSELEKSEYSELEKIVQDNWGQSTSDTKFKLPNLQGQFLRGVDYDTVNISDPDAENRKSNGRGLSREVGSWQEDAVGEHSHTFFNNHQVLGQESNSGGSNDANKRNGTREWPTTNNPIYKETRPKNYYINFIIRAQ